MSCIRVERLWEGEYPEVTSTPFQPIMCQHCGKAPCEPVCPVFATVHSDAEQINLQVYNRCVGPRYCANNCPYVVRVFNWFDYQRPDPLNKQLNPDVTVRRRGIMEKCSFCVQRIHRVEDAAKAEVREGQEFCPSKDPVSEFQPTALEMKEWIRTIKAAGMKYAVLRVRHTSELLLWDSRTSPINVLNSAYRKDLVKEYVTECRRQGVEPGFYYCLWGNAWRPNPNARGIILAQLHELATRYGKIAYFWLDMPHLTGWLAKDLSQQELYDSLKNVNADTIVMFNNTIQDGSVVQAFPTDVINGEMCLPPAQGHNPVRSLEGRTCYLPFEYEPCSQQRGYELLGRWGMVWVPRNA